MGHLNLSQWPHEVWHTFHWNFKLTISFFLFVCPTIRSSMQFIALAFGLSLSLHTHLVKFKQYTNVLSRSLALAAVLFLRQIKLIFQNLESKFWMECTNEFLIAQDFCRSSQLFEDETTQSNVRRIQYKNNLFLWREWFLNTLFD